MQFDVPIASVRDSWFACARDCGIFLGNPRVNALPAQLEEEELASQDLETSIGCIECWRSIVALRDVTEKQVIWTDGAASHNQDLRFRRAGSGIFYGEGHTMNLSTIVLGRLQSNQRAELLAVMLACLRDPRPVDIRSDSEYVCEGFASWRLWCSTGWQHDHADLWNKLAMALQSRATDVSVTWVKGHAKLIDVVRGRTTEEDKRGNDGADELARAGARMHHVSSEVVAAAKERRCVAANVQRMMLCVLKARLMAETLSPDDAEEIDRGSDHEECMSDSAVACAASDNEMLPPACLYK